jgi:hypothetical protein
MQLPINATLEERERLAYIEGRTQEAALLGEAIDAERKQWVNNVLHGGRHGGVFPKNNNQNK